MKGRPMTMKISAIAATVMIAFATPAFAEHHESGDAMSEHSMEAKTKYSGTWTKKSFKSSGTWEIFSEEGKTFVKLSDDFRTRNAPDLKIFLSPQAASEATGRNATDGAVLVSALDSNSGGQVYEIPEGVNLDDFQSILIHCEQFSKLWSAADLI